MNKLSSRTTAILVSLAFLAIGAPTSTATLTETNLDFGTFDAQNDGAWLSNINLCEASSIDVPSAITLKNIPVSSTKITMVATDLEVDILPQTYSNTLSLPTHDGYLVFDFLLSDAVPTTGVWNVGFSVEGVSGKELFTNVSFICRQSAPLGVGLICDATASTKQYSKQLHHGAEVEYAILPAVCGKNVGEIVGNDGVSPSAMVWQYVQCLVLNHNTDQSIMNGNDLTSAYAQSQESGHAEWQLVAEATVSTPCGNLNFGLGIPIGIDAVVSATGGFQTAVHDYEPCADANIRNDLQKIWYNYSAKVQLFASDFNYAGESLLFDSTLVVHKEFWARAVNIKGGVEYSTNDPAQGTEGPIMCEAMRAQDVATSFQVLTEAAQKAAETMVPSFSGATIEFVKLPVVGPIEVIESEGLGDLSPSVSACGISQGNVFEYEGNTVLGQDALQLHGRGEVVKADYPCEL
ncbi:MAG: hypothetical protein ACPHK8_03040 [Thermoplasmatota archaeon]